MENIRSIKQRSDNKGILFLAGVYKKDCKRLEDIFQDRLLYTNQETKSYQKYDSIPVNFTTLEEWPEKTNLLCWYCTRNIENRPWFEPQSIEPRSIGSVGKLLNKSQLLQSIHEHGVVISVKGIFCSCNCVRAYIDLHTSNIGERYNKIAMLKYVYEIFMNRSISDIRPSPKHTSLVQYGGSLTSSDYQKKINKLDNSSEQDINENRFNELYSLYLDKLIK